MGFGGFGPWEMFLIFLVVLLLFGAKRLPEIGSSLGKGIREFKSSVREIEGEFKVDDQRNQIHRSTPPPPKVESGEPRKLSEGPAAESTPQQAGQEASQEASQGA